MNANDDLPIMAFATRDELRAWLMANHSTSKGIWLRIYKKASDVPSVAFEEVLDEGLCFGWSESMRRKGDDRSYLQCFTPRRTVGTTSRRNLEHAERLIADGLMMRLGLKALGMDKKR